MKRLAIPAALLAVVGLAAPASAAGEPSTPALDITRVNYNAMGADTLANRWQEAIYLENPATTPLDISGWTVHDTYKNAEGQWGNAYTFPGAKGSETTVVKAGGLVIVTPSNGVDKTAQNATQVYYMDFKRGYNGHFLNNGGDTVYVDKADGANVTSFTYDFDNGYYVR
ncbi:lamin tail domain-containing protein [Microbispora rosea]|uniref:lamin tail domain-containing protein n=1 Tax=Microbispora rosea TaxID=58117 RepID=UPI0004C3DDDC|nr:lamin tail domain-containing protein [Microbispora rosea]